MKWMDVAKDLVGTKEIKGSKHNPVILSWAKGLGGWIGDYYTKDEIPWCGLFVAHCIHAAGLSFSQKSLSARSWNDWGQKCEPQYGAIMVFSRNGGGHVGFYISEDSSAYNILGGNQSDSVNITRVAKDRFLGARWPKELPVPKAKPIIVQKINNFFSKNEA